MHLHSIHSFEPSVEDIGTPLGLETMNGPDLVEDLGEWFLPEWERFYSLELQIERKKNLLDSLFKCIPLDFCTACIHDDGRKL